MTDLLREIGQRVAAAADEAYFVGGCVRDLLRGEPVKDVDLALSGDVYAIGKKVANAYQGHVFWLHQEEGVVRVALPRQGALQLDLCALRGTLDQDLRARDLTINAMAIPASEGLQAHAELVDPTGGREDLTERVIRFVSAEAPERDPLRTLRALRFRWKLGFELAPGTAARIAACVPLLERVSVERIRDELFQLLAIPEAPAALAQCLDFRTGRWFWGRELDLAPDPGLRPPLPQSRGRGSGRGPDSAPPGQVRAILSVLREAGEELRDLLGTEPTPPRRRREVLLWAAALQALASAIDPGAACRYLALSNDECRIITKAIGAVGSLRDLVQRWPVTGRERLRAFKRARPAEPEAVLLAGAGQWSPPYEELLAEALRRHLHPESPLLTGNELMQELRLKPGPDVGRLLETVEEARADGIVSSHEEALAWLREQRS